MAMTVRKRITLGHECRTRYAMAPPISTPVRRYKEYGPGRVRNSLGGQFRRVEAINIATCHTFPTRRPEPSVEHRECSTEIAASRDRLKGDSFSKSGASNIPRSLQPRDNETPTRDLPYISDAQSPVSSLARVWEHPRLTARVRTICSARIPYMFALFRALSALSQMHGARSGRRHQGAGGPATLAADLDHAVRRWRSAQRDPEVSGTRRRMADARVVTSFEEGRETGAIRVQSGFLRPHFQLEGMDLGFRPRFQNFRPEKK